MKCKEASTIRFFLCGDVMTGRGIDQILPYPSDPVIYESYVKDAREYVALAEEKNGKIPKSADFSYIWGDALNEFTKALPDVKIINLETSVTHSNEYWQGKGINYRMNPKNIPCPTRADIDCCVLANNHVLDWGYAGLTEKLVSLRDAGIKCSGAGGNLSEAETPAVLDVQGKGRVLVFSFGVESSGVPSEWAATGSKAGVNFLGDLSLRAVQRIKRTVAGVKRASDVVVFSVHWGTNWGYDACGAAKVCACAYRRGRG